MVLHLNLVLAEALLHRRKLRLGAFVGLVLIRIGVFWAVSLVLHLARRHADYCNLRVSVLGLLLLLGLLALYSLALWTLERCPLLHFVLLDLYNREFVLQFGRI